MLKYHTINVIHSPKLANYSQQFAFINSPCVVSFSTAVKRASLYEDAINSAGFGKVAYSTIRFVPVKSLLTCTIPFSAIMDKDLFYSEILKVGLESYQAYTVYVKIRYHKDKFFMAGNQFGFDYKSVNDFESLYSDFFQRFR
uniref:Uncharacterized protein n=1 Tax=Rhynchosporium secalis TaxID=38038 RepID=V5W6E7_RHYSE|nr:hypothetical protein [Rhynchosporium secalis]AHC02445.1 hypothetical protein [Rhynchosporium secalis]